MKRIVIFLLAIAVALKVNTTHDVTDRVVVPIIPDVGGR
jgi:hypothetical protein